MPPTPLRLPAALALAVLSGLGTVASLPRIDAWPLAFVALAPLAVAVSGQPALRAALVGWAAGLAAALPGMWWLHGTLEQFSGLSGAAGAAGGAAVVAAQALRPALAAWLAARAEAGGWPLGPAFVVALVGAEVSCPLLFPWTRAAALHGVPPLAQAAALGGPYALVLLLALVNAAVAEPWLARRERRRPRWAIVALGVSLVPLAFAGGTARIRAIEATLAAAPSGRVGLVQANLGILAKARDREQGVRRHVELTRALEATHGPLDLVVWSETSVMTPLPERDAERELAVRVGAQVRSPVIAGAVLVREGGAGARASLLNSAVMVGRDPTQHGRYDKRTLLPFTEYLPLERWLSALRRWSPRTGRFVPGDRRPPLQLGDRGLTVFICYEDVLPEAVREGVVPGVTDVLVNLTNDAWFGDTAEPWQHLALAKLRAIEHGRYLIRATNSGVSAVVDPAGRVVASAAPFGEATAVADIRWLRGRTVWGDVGAAPWWGFAIAAAALALARRPGHENAAPERRAPGVD